jgi:hypothetical protein
MSDVLTMREAAAALGYHYDWFRKVWRKLVSEEGLPRPFLRRKWDRDALERWKAQRSGPASGEGPQSPARTAPPDGRARARQQLERVRDR